jgi:hypothetical protein
MKPISIYYLDGIKEGRQVYQREGMADADAHIENLAKLVKDFDASNPIGQMLRGELAFWRHQKSRKIMLDAQDRIQ